MEKSDVTWKVFGMYMLIIILLLFSNASYGQLQLVVFNASWNDANKVEWAWELEDVQTQAYIDISKDTKLQKKHKIAVIPTIIIFKDGEEVERFQADISFSIKATKKELQEVINEQLMSDF